MSNPDTGNTGFMFGVFANKAFNPAGVDGLLLGNTHFFLIQIKAVVIS